MDDLAALRREVQQLIADVTEEGTRRRAAWGPDGPRTDFEAGADNLARYLALRHRDLRPLQQRLMVHGLSSLGRLESRVMPGLCALDAALARLSGDPAPPDFPGEDAFFAGQRELARHTAEVFGEGGGIGLMVTAPPEAATDPGFARALATRGVQSLRINCAHDDEDAWHAMIANARMAEDAGGRRLRVFMDLAGPKIRTADVRLEKGEDKGPRLRVGDAVLLLRPGEAGPGEDADARAACTLEAPLLSAEPGHRVFYDDGKVGLEVVRREPWGLRLRVTQAPGDGARLKDEKGLNFPDTAFRASALTEKDQRDLAFIARHADGVNYSFVQAPEDVALLQRALKDCPRERPEPLALVLKIETPEAVRRLPDLLAAAASRQPTAVMIARGDLAVEIGFARTAEMQEEMLWLCEAAHVPVVWATQVLEHFIKEGRHSRGEMTDAAMGARAECVMLNKGPHVLEAIDILQQLFPRMGGHLQKKTPQLRPLATWAR